jgi:hypothetical protein
MFYFHVKLDATLNNYPAGCPISMEEGCTASYLPPELACRSPRHQSPATHLLKNHFLSVGDVRDDSAVKKKPETVTLIKLDHLCLDH